MASQLLLYGELMFLANPPFRYGEPTFTRARFGNSPANVMQGKGRVLVGFGSEFGVPRHSLQVRRNASRPFVKEFLSIYGELTFTFWRANFY